MLPSATSRNTALFSSCDSSLTSILFPVLQVEEYLNTCNCSGLILTGICFRVGSAAVHLEEEPPLQGTTAGLGSHRWTIRTPLANRCLWPAAGSVLGWTRTIPPAKSGAVKGSVEGNDLRIWILLCTTSVDSARGMFIFSPVCQHIALHAFILVHTGATSCPAEASERI